MKQKDLAEEYAHKAFLKRNRNNPMSIYDLCFSVTDIKAAFNAGRESVVENMPELKWNFFCEDGLYFAPTTFGFSYRIEFVYNEFHLFCNHEFISCYISLSAAKQEANENCKQYIKQALGL